MLTQYIHAAMKMAEYEILKDGTFFGRIPPCRGAWANEKTLEACREELQSVLENWILFGVEQHLPLPVIDGISLSSKPLRKKKKKVA